MTDQAGIYMPAGQFGHLEHGRQTDLAPFGHLGHSVNQTNFPS